MFLVELLGMVSEGINPREKHLETWCSPDTELVLALHTAVPQHGDGGSAFEPPRHTAVHMVLYGFTITIPMDLVIIGMVYMVAPNTPGTRGTKLM